MTFASKRFDNRLKRFRALVGALTIILFSIVVHGQQTSTTEKTQSTSAKPMQSPSQSSSQRRVQAVRITGALKIDGLLDEAAWSSAQLATDFLEQQPTEGAAASDSFGLDVFPRQASSTECKRFAVGGCARSSRTHPVNGARACL